MIGKVSDFQRRLLSWYRRNRRDLPWRATGRNVVDPYHVLVSELMLQQTQVATVVPYFLRFIGRFPTAAALSSAPLDEVLRLWQGLGYYARAQNLQKAARQIVEEHAGRVPADVATLLKLPGIGRYTAGAIASTAFGVAAPIVDGNVARVLCRVDAIEGDPRQLAIRDQLWERSAQILPARQVGDFNSALMELGATICVPRQPRCEICPVASSCQAREQGRTAELPPPRRTNPIPLHYRITVCVRHGNRWLLERRPNTGRWAGLWQFPTFEGKRAPTPGKISRELGIVTGPARPLGRVEHALSHRRYRFEAFICRLNGLPGKPASDSARAWVALVHLSEYPMGRPQLLISEMLREDDSK